jgi:hypothetical protein
MASSVPASREPDGGAEALGGADGDGVRVLAPLAGRDAGRGLGVEEPGAVEVDLEAALPRHGGGGGEVFQRVDLAAGGVVGVLQAEQARAREVDVLWPDRLPDGLGVEDAAVAGEGAELDAGEQGRGAALVDKDVGALVDQDLLGPAGVDVDPDLVGHRPRRRVYGRLFAEQVGDVLLQPVDGRVLPEDVVPQGRLHHGPPHALRRPRYRVAAKIYHWLPPSSLPITRFVVAKWVFATRSSSWRPRSRTTRRPASRTCVAPSGSRKPTLSERRSISSNCRARARIEAAATAASSSARGRTSSRTPGGTEEASRDRADFAYSSTTISSTSS